MLYTLKYVYHLMSNILVLKAFNRKSNFSVCIILGQTLKYIPFYKKCLLLYKLTTFLLVSCYNNVFKSTLKSLSFKYNVKLNKLFFR